MRSFFEIPDSWSKNEPFVAVSGGKDSMVLLHFLISNGVKPKVLHCNFNLRGQDSDLDQQLVETYCEKNGLELRVKQFNTASLKRAQESLQMLCRRLRYEWFKEELGKGDELLLAHHKGDQLETLLMSVNKKKNLFEFSGIPKRNGNYYRPLLEVDKEGIKEYAKENEVPYREDKSNLESKYLRNFFRNEVIPVLSKSFLDRLWKVHEAVLKIKKSWQNDFIEWDKNESISLSEANELKLIQYLISRGFTKDSAEKIAENKGKNGLTFLTIDKRQYVIFDSILHPKKQEDVEEVYIDPSQGDFVFGDKKYKLSMTDSNSEPSIRIDASQINWPLLARSYSKEDRMILMGMKGSKKVKDIFKELKIPPSDRCKYFILEDAQKNIIALEFLRRSDFALLSKNTQNVLQIS